MRKTLIFSRNFWLSWKFCWKTCQYDHRRRRKVSTPTLFDHAAFHRHFFYVVKLLSRLPTIPLES